MLRLKNANFRYNTAKIQNNRSDISIKEIYHIFKIDKGFVDGKLESQPRSAQVALSLIIWSIMSVCELKFLVLKPTSFAGKRYGKFPLLVKFDAQTGQI